MNFIILPLITLILCGVAFIVFIQDLKANPLEKAKKAKETKEADEDAKEESEETKESAPSENKIFTKGMITYSVIMTLITIAISIVFCICYADNGILANIKRMALLSLMWPVAYIDFKSYRIPNRFILLGIVYRIIIFPFELFVNPDVWSLLLSEIIAAGALLLASLLCSLCMKNSIGFGDIKLFIVMGLLLSMDGIWGAMFLSLIISFLLALFLLITKRKGRKDTIPFGPSIVLGTYLSVFLTGM
ncbi:MAG: A24 family peptidase [Acutalibacteraceae bacterium]|nr:A24 family peptidase [Acutalibacteraceae bacterium]